MTIILAIPVILVVWAFLGRLAMSFVEKDILNRIGLAGVRGLVRDRMYLEFFDEKNMKSEERKQQAYDSLLAPINCALYFINRNLLIEKYKERAQELSKRASNIRQTRFTAKKVWLHPAETSEWSMSYNSWFNKTITPVLIQARREMSFGRASKALTTAKECLPCQCVIPILGKLESGKAHCREGHILPGSPSDLLN